MDVDAPTRPPGGRLNVVAADTKTLVAFASAPELESFFTWNLP